MQLPIDIDAQGREVIQRILLTILILISVYLIVRGAQRATLRFIEGPERRYRASKIIGRMGTLTSFVLIVILWAEATDSLVTILSVVGAGLVIANREFFLSMVGRLNIALRAPYVPSDRIEINGITGDVIDIRLIHTSLMEVGGWVDADQSTGRIVHIPHAWIFQYGVFNYTQGFSFIWNELSVTLTADSDWESARDIMLSFAQESAAIVEQQVSKQIRRMSREYLVHYSILTPFVYVQIVNNGIQLSLRYLCEVRKRRGTEHALTVSMLRAFRDHEHITLVAGPVSESQEKRPRGGPLPRSL